MGREIRRVPPNWQHPKEECNHGDDCNECFIPLLNQNYDEAAKQWLNECALWEKGDHLDQSFHESAKKYKYFWEWQSPPGPLESYRLYKDEEATWYQVYETVSEGTPITPAFETQNELVEYLIQHGDFWKQRRERGIGYTREVAENFVYGDGYATSFIVSNGVIKEGIEFCSKNA